MVVYHDNGINGARGYSEYSIDDINSIGGMDKLRANYLANGITIYDVFSCIA